MPIKIGTWTQNPTTTTTTTTKMKFCCSTIQLKYINKKNVYGKVLAHKIACVIHQIDSLRQHVSYLPSKEEKNKNTQTKLSQFTILGPMLYENYDEMSKSEESIALEMPTI